MSRNSIGGRASLGGGDTAEIGRKSTKAAPVVDEKMTYGFPMLKMGEIIQCLHALEFKVTQNQLADIENHKEVYKDILESSVYWVFACPARQGNGFSSVQASDQPFSFLCSRSTACELIFFA